ncbi:hypothetical protein D3C71_2145820 [compost metagenome]
MKELHEISHALADQGRIAPGDGDTIKVIAGKIQQLIQDRLRLHQLHLILG